MVDDTFEQIAYDAWEATKTPLEHMYDKWVGVDNWLPEPEPTKFRIYDKVTGLPLACHICGATDDWFVEGDEVRQIARVFVHEHEPIYGIGMACRQVSTVPVHKVGRFERTTEVTD